MIAKALKWAFEEAKEKLNVFATIREIKALGQKYGRRFLIMAAVWEVIEDVVFPFLSYKAGLPELIPIFLILHFEPVVYPVAFWAFKTYDRMKGRAPWEPDRTAMSSHWRTLAKITLYRLTSIALFMLAFAATGINHWFLAVYMTVMALFSFAHERIWHDSNYGITATDQVEPKRLFAKVATYRGVSILVMGMGLYGFLAGEVPWGTLIAYQCSMLIAHIVLEGFWARNTWGIKVTTPEATLDPKTGIVTLDSPVHPPKGVILTYSVDPETKQPLWQTVKVTYSNNGK